MAEAIQVDQVTQTTQEYDKNLNKELIIPIAGSIQQGIVTNLATTNLSSGSLNGRIVLSKDAVIIVPDGTNDRVKMGNLNS